MEYVWGCFRVLCVRGLFSGGARKCSKVSGVVFGGARKCSEVLGKCSDFVVLFLGVLGSARKVLGK
eukprot:6667449-Heterocapsa_arctica.AAC.1